MPKAGFEPAIPASERPQTHALDRAVTGISKKASHHFIQICTKLFEANYCLHLQGDRTRFIWPLPESSKQIHLPLLSSSPLRNSDWPNFPQTSYIIEKYFRRPPDPERRHLNLSIMFCRNVATKCCVQL
jgi:hypothetical protein